MKPGFGTVCRLQGLQHLAASGAVDGEPNHTPAPRTLPTTDTLELCGAGAAMQSYFEEMPQGQAANIR